MQLDPGPGREAVTGDVDRSAWDGNARNSQDWGQGGGADRQIRAEQSRQQDNQWDCCHPIAQAPGLATSGGRCLGVRVGVPAGAIPEHRSELHSATRLTQGVPWLCGPASRRVCLFVDVCVLSLRSGTLKRWTALEELP
jgi:hypothetical protein